MNLRIESQDYPLTGPSGTLSPSGGEGTGEGVRFMEIPLTCYARALSP